MPRPFFLAVTVLVALGFTGAAMAQTQNTAVGTRNVSKKVVKTTARTKPVVITPRYLTGGTQVSPDERRGAVVNADPRYRTTARNIAGYDQVNLRQDPFYLPSAAPVLTFDTPFGRKANGEN